MKKALALASVLLLVFSVATFSSCGGEMNTVDRLAMCHQASNDYAQKGGYFHFGQESQYNLTTAEGVFEQKVGIEGDSILPYRQSYEYQESVSSSKASAEPQLNAFSYLTLDQGKSAFVKGERLSTQLGVEGWIHYTPPPGQNRYFDFPQLMDKLTDVDTDVEMVGYEDVEGTPCVHLRYTLQGQKLLDLRMQESPELEEKYRDVDLEAFVGDLQVEIWIREFDNLPQLIQVDQALTLENNVSSANHIRMLFSGWGEESPEDIVQPASYTEAL